MAVQSIPVGTKFGRLTVIGEAEPNLDKHGYKCGKSVVKCECGTERIVYNGNLRSGKTKSCGCGIGEQHGKRSAPEYRIWAHLKGRCTNPNNKKYPSYGGRGIKVCERWMNSFATFLEDMGPRPSDNHSIDRIDNSGHYEPSNCRWATSMEQGRNKRNNRLFVFYGKSMPLSQWCEIAQISPDAVTERLKRGWSEKTAFWTPVKRKRKVS